MAQSTHARRLLRRIATAYSSLVQYPATPQPPQHPQAFVPPLSRRIRKVGAPLGVIIALGTIAGLIVLLFTALNPVGAVIGIVLATTALVVVVLAFVWLDRWEPEPPRLLILAFLWGASVSVVFSVGLELVFEALVPADANTASAATVALGAPLVEEALKGSFLLLMLTGRRRNELNSLTDCLVYAGITAIGFAWVENIMYIAQGETLAESLLTAGLRLIMGPFAHPLFTLATGIGVYFALNRRNVLAKIGCVLLGYAGAVLLHAMWNGSSLVSIEAYFLVYVFWMVPVFGLAVWLAIASRRREQRITAAKLPGMVAANLVTANEATWLGSIKTRKVAIAEVTRLGGKSAAKGVKDFAAQVVELAFVRDRIDRGFGDARVVALQNEEAYWVLAARAQAPALQSLAAYRARP
ncbi:MULTISPECIES: PrsW family intramembrane metalloprotease [unclassified Mycobacterium]|uniref:PrsW family intramembrane metalloprotease n=1 Tax=unclassified Mycobacterium TaxID=2642494 RepID=UPI0029C87AE0|nr:MULTISPECIES: PrsW family intramembrane metalloprotease [unclassified Mycobacterium]